MRPDELLLSYIRNQYQNEIIENPKHPIIKAILFSGNAITTNYNDIMFDKTSFAILLILFGFSFIYKKVKKKNLSALIILLLAACLGMLVF